MRIAEVSPSVSQFSDAAARALLEQTADVVVVLHADGTIVQTNQSESGYPGFVAVGGSIFDVLGEEYWSRVREALHRAGELGQVTELEVAWNAENRYRIKLVPLNEDGVEVDRVLLIGTNVTTFYLAENLLKVSESQLRQVFDAAPLPMAAVDVRGRLIHANRQFNEQFGAVQKSRDLTSIYSLASEDDSAVLRAALGSVFAGSSTQAIRTIQLVTVRGIWEWCEITASGVPDSDGQVRQAVVAVSALSERDESRRELALRTARLHEAQAIGQFGSFHWEPASDTLQWSEELFRIFGIDPSAFLVSYQSYMDRVHPDDVSMVKRLVDEALREQRPFDFEYRIIRPDGEVRWVITRARPATSPGSNARQLEGTCQDITDRKLAEERLRCIGDFHEALIRTAAEGICASHDLNDRPGVQFTLWNERMVEITGYTMEEVNRLGWYQCLFAQGTDHARALRRLARMRQGEPLRGDLWELTRKDRTLRSVSLSSSQIVEADGQLLDVILMHDVTDRVAAERAARENETRFAQFVEALPQIVWIASPDNQTHFFVNAAYERILGLDPSDLTTKPMSWMEVIHPLDRERIARRLANHPEGVHIEEFRIVRPDGKLRWIENRVIPIFNDSGEVYLRVGLSDDITERKRAEEIFAQQQNQLARTARLNILGEMVAGITHEITQPLTAIVNFAGACCALMEKEPPGNHDLLHYVQEIRNQSVRTGRIVHGLRDLARRAEPRREMCDLAKVVEEAVALLRNDLRLAQVELTLQMADPGPVLFADRVQLQQVIVNLARNALDAVQCRSPADRRVIIRTSSQRTLAEFSCEDNGCGLPEGYEKRLFKAFYTSKPDGMGMGLAICRTIVEAHGGQLMASNNDQSGATIRFLLPLFRPDRKE